VVLFGKLKFSKNEKGTKDLIYCYINFIWRWSNN